MLRQQRNFPVFIVLLSSMASITTKPLFYIDIVLVIKTSFYRLFFCLFVPFFVLSQKRRKSSKNGLFFKITISSQIHRSCLTILPIVLLCCSTRILYTFLLSTGTYGFCIVRSYRRCNRHPMPTYLF